MRNIMKQTQNLRQTQKMMPAMVMNQKILAIPAIALENLIRKELEFNPLLEETTESASDDLNDNLNTASESEMESTDNENEESVAETESSIESKIDNEYDWDEYFENEAEENKIYSSDNSFSYDYNNIKEDGNSLRDSLLLQLHLSELNKKEIFIGEEIIWSLNDDGYCTVSIEDILQDLNFRKRDTEFDKDEFSEEDIFKVIEFFQMNFDPKGISARDLKECLIIQLERSEISSDLKKIACEIINNHLEDLRLKKFEKICDEMNISIDKAGEVFEIIQKLNPKPGFVESHSEENFINPDLVVKKNDGKYDIYLNDSFIPSLRISKTYKDMFLDKGNKLDKDTKEYLYQNFNRAKWFIDSINSRRETILNVMTAIVKRQKKYFDNNGEGLKVLYEKDIADDIKMDTSTVSRTVRGKYVQTDFGIYELRSFFSAPFHRSDDNGISNKEIKNVLKNIILHENKEKPLTDEELSEQIIEKGFKISRRTIGKYRESLNIPIAKLRREIKKSSN